jgi:hypothetical protein
VRVDHRTWRWFEAEPISDVTLLLATLEYGDIHALRDMLRITRRPGDPPKSVLVHPVIRARTDDGAQEIHLEDSLLNRFVGIPANHRRSETFVARCGNSRRWVVVVAAKRSMRPASGRSSRA